MRLQAFFSRLPKLRHFVLALAAALTLSLAAANAVAQVEDAVATDTADDAALRTLLAQFVPVEGNYAATATIVGQIAAMANADAAPALQALDAGNLYFRKADNVLFIGTAGGAGLLMSDPVTAESLGDVATAAATKIRVNNAVRRAVRTAIGTLTLLSPDRTVRLSAALSIFASRDATQLPLLQSALAAETDAGVRAAMAQAEAAIVVANAAAAPADRMAALELIKGRGDQDALNILRPLATDDDPAIAAAATSAVSSIETSLKFWAFGQNIWYGVSLGSVLLLAAIGLAITFGVMGIINMAHGEMVMLGAYTTYVVQATIRSSAPGLGDWSIIIAIPIAFIVTGFIGVVMERSIIRWLYGRPLETLLATWGISLILIQGVRLIFGPLNKLVTSPSWMSGSFEIGHLTVTYTRLWIVIFSAAVFLILMVVLKRTSFGLRMRAVTQNRRMASAMGIKTPWVDALTFGLGSGIAGLAGVALSQIDNVSPNLGQNYIVDSFMVVVFGGVGNLWGTLVGAMSLGIVNKFLEPYAGAVLGKIFILVIIILFIQRRPRGLFALRGRAIES